MNNVKKNYQAQLDKLIASLPADGEPPRLLLHACCAPCSSYTLEYLSQYFSITLYFYNPNITSQDEFEKRAAELARLVSILPVKNEVRLIIAPHDPQEFFSAVKGLEDIPEGGERCFICYRQRLEAAAEYAARNGFDYFVTTLSISPYKNAQKLNEIGEELSQIYGVAALPCDLKKRGGYKRSIELSAKYSLYRQNYCGCIFSKKEREKREAQRLENFPDK